MTLSEILSASASRFPGKAALVSSDGLLTFEELHRQSLAITHFLLDQGLGSGDRVAILSTKRPEAITAFLGAAGAGCAAFTLDYNLSPQSLRSLLDLTKPSLVCVEECFMEPLAIAAAAGSIAKWLVIGNSRDRTIPGWNDVIRRCIPGGELPEVAPDDVAYLNITSGTTGRPKAVCTTHANLYHNTASAVRALRLGPEDVHLCLFPIFGHPHEIFMRALFLGGTAVLHDNLRPSSIAAAVGRYRVTTTMAATTIYQTILADSKMDRTDLSTIRVAECGGMHLCPSVHARFFDRFGLEILPVWGSTETAGIAFAQDPEEAYVPGSVGRPCAAYEVSLVDESGAECRDGEPGELRIRGSGVCTSHCSADGRRVSQLRGGWFYSGDIFHRDPPGRYFFHGRNTGMLKVAGMRVYPVELEDVLATHPAVAEVAVCAVPHPTRGEVPKAVVVLRAEHPADAEMLRDFCRNLLPPYKVPKIFEFRPSLPKSAGGKILYAQLT